MLCRFRVNHLITPGTMSKICVTNSDTAQASNFTLHVCSRILYVKIECIYYVRIIGFVYLNLACLFDEWKEVLKNKTKVPAIQLLHWGKKYHWPHFSTWYCYWRWKMHCCDFHVQNLEFERSKDKCCEDWRNKLVTKPIITLQRLFIVTAIHICLNRQSEITTS